MELIKQGQIKGIILNTSTLLKNDEERQRMLILLIKGLQEEIREIQEKLRDKMEHFEFDNKKGRRTKEMIVLLERYDNLLDLEKEAQDTYGILNKDEEE
jgi:hypothetical protein